jgi:hemerythrin superfamily protein
MAAHTAPHAARATARAKSDIDPQPILDTLHADHEEVSAMFEEMCGGKSGDVAETFKKIKEELTAHAKAEQKVLYTRMKKGEEESKDFALEGTVEHEVIEKLLDQLSRSRTKTSDEWMARAKVLKEVVKHHVKEEESEGFKAAREEFGEDELIEMNAEFQREKQKLLK